MQLSILIASKILDINEKICKEILYVQGGIWILNHEIVGNKISNITSEMYFPEILPEMIE